MTPPTDIAHWRRQIFSRLLTIVLVLGLVTAVPCIAIAGRERMWPMIGVVLLSTAWLVGVWYLTALSYTARVLNLDRTLGDKLVQELPGIFVWALEGQARLRLQDAFTMPPSSLEAMEDFKVCRNSVSLFKRDCIELPNTNLTLVGGSNKADRIPSHDLYKTYKAYCSANTYQAFAKEGFGKKLKELGVEQIRTGGKRYYTANKHVSKRTVQRLSVGPSIRGRQFASPRFRERLPQHDRIAVTPVACLCPVRRSENTVPITFYERCPKPPRRGPTRQNSKI